MYIISFFHLHFLLIQDTLKFCHENTRTCRKVHWQPWPQPQPLPHPFHLSFSIITAWVTTTILGLSVISQLWQYLIKTSRGWAVSSSDMECTVRIAKLSSSWLVPVNSNFNLDLHYYHCIHDKLLLLLTHSPSHPDKYIWATSRLSRMLKFGMEALFNQTRSTS